MRKGIAEERGERQQTRDEGDGRKAVADKIAPPKFTPARTTPSQAGAQGGQGRKRDALTPEARSCLGSEQVNKQ
jgi:hypothetical protein